MAGENELCLFGTVGESFWGEACFTAQQVRETLATMTGAITVRINSGGGMAPEGQTIHNLLRDYPGEVRVVIEGIAASAASLIAMAGDRIVMRQGSLMMIHDPALMFTDGRGTEDDHLRTAAALRVASTAYARVYARRAGITVEEARSVMRAETYYEGPDAVAAGFADEVEDVPALPAAAFDYGIYAHAPDALKGAGVTKAGTGAARRSRTAVLAMIAGGWPGAEEIEMNKQVKATSQEEEETTAIAVEVETEDDEEEMPAPEQGEAAPETAGDGEDDDEEDAAARAVAILDLCLAVGRPASEAREMIARKLTLRQAVAEMTGRQRKEVPMHTIKPGAPTARILRDERDTMRAGMTGALVAQMARARDVSGPARSWMGHSLVEMAAAAVGHRGRIRSASDRLEVMRMALGSHSTSDFPAVFENALNKRMLDAWENAPITYRAVAQRMDFVDFRPHPVSGVGDFPGLRPVSETGEIAYGTVSDKKENLQLSPAGVVLSISRQMLINDDLGAIDRILASRGRAVATWEEKTFYDMMLSGANADGPTLLETTRQVFNTTDGTKASTAAAISPTSVALGYKALREQRGIGASAPFLNLTPAILLTGPTKEFEAAQLLAPIQAAQASNVNPYVGKLIQVTSPYITGNAWYLFADPVAAPVFAYGYLSGQEGPRLRMDEPFGTQGVAYSIELDFGAGAVDRRGGYKNAGA